MSSQAVRPEHLKNENTSPPRIPKGVRPQRATDWSKHFMTPEEVGERVVRGIKEMIFSFGLIEFREGIKARNDALYAPFLMNLLMRKGLKF